MVFTVSLLLNFTPRMPRLGIARKQSPDKVTSPWGAFTILDLQTTIALVLLGFSIMHPIRGLNTLNWVWQLH